MSPKSGNARAPLAVRVAMVVIAVVILEMISTKIKAKVR